VSEELYKHAAATGAAGGDHAEHGHEEPAAAAKKADKGDVVDADFEVIDDDKKKH